MQSPDQRSFGISCSSAAATAMSRAQALRHASVPGVRLTVICRDTIRPIRACCPAISPGITVRRGHIDLSRLARFAGARLFRDEALGLDRDAARCCAASTAGAYDYLSINIGSYRRWRVAEAAEHAVPVNRSTAS